MSKSQFEAARGAVLSVLLSTLVCNSYAGGTPSKYGDDEFWASSGAKSSLCNDVLERRNLLKAKNTDALLDKKSLLSGIPGIRTPRWSILNGDDKRTAIETIKAVERNDVMRSDPAIKRMVEATIADIERGVYEIASSEPLAYDSRQGSERILILVPTDEAKANLDWYDYGDHYVSTERYEANSDWPLSINGWVFLYGDNPQVVTSASVRKIIFSASSGVTMDKEDPRNVPHHDCVIYSSHLWRPQ